MIEIIIGVMLVVSFYLGYWFRGCLISIAGARYQRGIEKSIAEVEKRAVHVVIEKEGNTFLVYNKTTDEFLAQGKTHTEIINQLEKSFPDTYFSVDKDNLKSIGYKHERL